MMKFIGSKTLETDRLILRSSKMQEQKRLWEILMDPNVNKLYLTSGKKHAKEKEYWEYENQKKFYISKVNHALDNDVFCWSIFLKKDYTLSKKEEVIGQISVQKKDDDNLSVRDIGWYIDPLYQRKGYAYESAKKVLEYMFKEVEIKKIDSGAVKANIPSCILFEKLGFTKTGEVTHESNYTFYDGLLTFSKYELTKEDYLNKK